ncbi:MAG: helix-turn-helix domain-containing protein [Deltaproteobacteria bacterium]|nr:helix-turn-helix domain-containing protein [Deltaproteobacteria bacterium]
MRTAAQRAVSQSPLPRRTRSPKKPVFMRGGVVYPIPSRKILDSVRKGYPKGDAIKAFREAINLNVREFAFFIGVDPATVFRWETKRTGKLQLGSLSKVMKLVNSVAAGKPVKIPTVARLFI